MGCNNKNYKEHSHHRPQSSKLSSVWEHDHDASLTIQSEDGGQQVTQGLSIQLAMLTNIRAHENEWWRLHRRFELKDKRLNDHHAQK